MAIKLTDKQLEAWKLLDSLNSEILLYGGSRSGKTFLIILYIFMRALTFPGTNHLICRQHLSDIKSSLIEGTIPIVTRLLDESLYDYWRSKFNNRHSFIRFPNDSQIWFNGFADARRTEKALGNEFSTILANEVSQMGDYRIIEKLLGRLAQKVCFNRFIIDCNPTTKAHWAYKKFIKGIDPIDNKKKDFDTAYLVMNPAHNQENLPADYIKRLSKMSARQRARFRDGLWQNEIEGALWSCEMLEKCRGDAPESFDRVAVAIDPSGTAKKTSDECGIVVGGIKKDKGYLLEDLSGKMSPSTWARCAINAYHQYQADCIIAEVNYGGDMVKSTIKLIDPNVNVKTVVATRNKVRRAEPIVALYEEGRIIHTRIFDELEDQMTGWTYTSPFSPDRLDATVWLFTALMLKTARHMIY